MKWLFFDASIKTISQQMVFDVNLESTNIGIKPTILLQGTMSLVGNWLKSKY